MHSASSVSAQDYRYNQYDATGQLQGTRVVTRDPSSRTVHGSSIVNYQADASLPGLGYDAAGNLLGMRQASFDASFSATSSTTTRYQYQHLKSGRGGQVLHLASSRSFPLSQITL